MSWDNPIDKAIVDPYFLIEMNEKLGKIIYNLKVSQDRQKNYVDKNISRKEFKS